MLDNNNQNYYDLLELLPDASPQEIRTAYLRAKDAYKKDSLALYSLMDNSETDQILEQIERAYQILSNPETRREYDRNHDQKIIPHPNPPLPSPQQNVPRYHEPSPINQEILQEVEWRGSFLKKIRENQNTSIEEISGFTKISKTYLQAIEEENYAKLPAPVYLRGFVIQVAKFLKLPHEKVAAAYMARYPKK